MSIILRIYLKFNNKDLLKTYKNCDFQCLSTPLPSIPDASSLSLPGQCYMVLHFLENTRMYSTILKFYEAHRFSRAK